MADSIVKRTTLIVADANRSIAFYRDVLGLKEYYNQQMSVGGTIIPAGEPGATVHLGIMEGPDPDIGKLGILQWTNPPLPRRPKPRQLGVGDLTVVTETNDMEGLYARLKASPDCHIHCPPHHWKVPLPDGSGYRALETLSFFDPDGFFFEVNHKPTEPQPDGLVIRRTTLIVADLAASIKFYRDTLGLAVWHDIQMILDGKILPAGKPGANVRVVILRGESLDTGMIGLLGFFDPPLPQPEAVRTTLGIGDSVIVASARDQDVTVLHSRIQTSPGRVHAEPAVDEVTGADGATIKLTTLSLFDPDGFFIELNERRIIQ
jgi:catechol 2,3-dioxygenase-like lactoylglutathione lyase family enzyme